MTKFYLIFINVLLVLSLAGCGTILPVASIPLVYAPPGIVIPEHTLGPASSDEFPALIQSAIPKNEAEVQVFGRVKWYGFQKVNRKRHLLLAVAAITNTDILLLMWHEPENQYTILKKISYSEIQTIEWGFDGRVYLYFDGNEVLLGGQIYKLEGKTVFDFLTPSGLWSDLEKNRIAFAFLQDKIKLHGSPPVTAEDDR